MQTSISQTPLALWIPYWMRPVMAINKITVDDLICMEDIVKRFPHETIESFKAVNTFMSHIVPSLHGLHKTDVSFVEDITERLTRHAGLPIIDDKPTYEIIRHDPKVYIIYVERGFIDTIRIREQQLAFVSECLKVQYSLLPIHEVSSSPLFGRYLDLLNQKVPFLGA